MADTPTQRAALLGVLGSTLKGVAVGGLVVLAAGALLSWLAGDVERAQARADASMLAATQAAADAGVAINPPRAAAPWEYREARHELSGGRVRQACTLSTNTIRLDWPYQSQQLRLCLRRHPTHGEDVIVDLPRGGQFVCRVDGCTVQVRMGGGAPSGFTVLEPADGSNDALFISNRRRFVRGLRRADEVAIEAIYYQAGAQTATFNTSNLEWESPTPSPPVRAEAPPATEAPQEKDPETAAAQFQEWLDAQPAPGT